MYILYVLILALAPVLAILFYLYFRDKYEKEPIILLVATFLLGGLSTLPIIVVEQILSHIWINYLPGFHSQYTNAFYNAFVVAGFTEELFKYVVFMALIWWNKNFNERFDGIIYAGFISLGFAAVENVLYVYSGGTQTGIMRAVTAVPLHALVGVNMGYFFALAKFDTNRNQLIMLFLAFFVPFAFHGIYDFILMSHSWFLLLFFVPFIIIMYVYGFQKMKRHSDDSVFKKTNEDF